MEINIQSNGSVIQPNVQTAKATVNTANLAAQAKGLGELGENIGKISVAFQKQEKESDAQKMMEAENEYARQIGDLKTKIQADRRLGNAKGSAQYFQQESARIKNEVYGKSGIKYQDTANLFNVRTERINIADQDTMDQYETSETDKNFNIQLNNNITTHTNKALQTGNPQDITLARTSIFETIDSPQAKGRFGEEWAEAKKRESITGLVKSAVEAKIMQEDTIGAMQVLNENAPYLDQAEFTKHTAMINKVNQEIFNNKTVSSIRKKGGDLLTPEQFEGEYKKEKVPYFVPGKNQAEEFDKGEGTLWKKQTGNVKVDNLLPEAKTQAVTASEIVKKNGGTFVITSGTDGTSHAKGEKDHYKGWKIDIESHTMSDDQLNKVVTGLNEAGMVATVEDRGGANEHIDIVLTGGSNQPQERFREPTEAEVKGAYKVYLQQVQLDDAMKQKQKNKVIDDGRNYILSFRTQLGEDPSPDVMAAKSKEIDRWILVTSGGDAEIESHLRSYANQQFPASSMKPVKYELSPALEARFLEEASLGSMGTFETEESIYKFGEENNLPSKNVKEMAKTWRETNDAGSSDIVKSAWVGLGKNSGDLSNPENQGTMAQAVSRDKIYQVNYKKEHGVNPTLNDRVANVKQAMAKQTIEDYSWYQASNDITTSQIELRNAGIAKAAKMAKDSEGNSVNNLWSVINMDGSYEEISEIEFKKRIKGK